MTKRQKVTLFVLNKLSGTCNWMGDIIVFIWLLQAVVGFEWSPDYWFAGVNTWYGSVSCWMISWLFHIFETHCHKKYKS